MLKKEFKRKDVNRLRNLIRGKSGDSSGTQIGYNKTQKEYKEGDVWVENKKTWTIKNGIKQTVSKLDKIRKEAMMPLCCPNCGNVMKKRLDKPNYKIHKMCYDCVINFEGKLRIQGKYEKYKNNLKNKNYLEIVDEMEAFLLDAINTSNEGFVSENGDIERWVGGIDKEKMTKEVKEASKIRREYIKKQLDD